MWPCPTARCGVGVDFIAAITIVAEIGDLRRFPHSLELLGYLGLVLSESSQRRIGVRRDAHGELSSHPLRA